MRRRRVASLHKICMQKILQTKGSLMLVRDLFTPYLHLIDLHVLRVQFPFNCLLTRIRAKCSKAIVVVMYMRSINE